MLQGSLELKKKTGFLTWNTLLRDSRRVYDYVELTFRKSVEYKDQCLIFILGSDD